MDRIIAHTVPLRQRPMYMGTVGAMEGVSATTGPLIGGALTTNVSWRWCFYINLPIGAVTILAVLAFYHEPDRDGLSFPALKQKAKDLDWLGMVVIVTAIICFVLALQWGGVTYAWSNGRVIALLVISAVLFAIFTVVQVRRGELATLPPRIIRQRSMAFGILFAFCGACALSIIDFYVSPQLRHGITQPRLGSNLS